MAGLPLLTGCEIQGLFQYFPGPFRANLRAFFTCILTQQLALQDLLLRKNQASVYVFKHCYIEGTSCPVTASSSFALLFTGKDEKLCPFQDFQGPQPKFNGLPGPGIFFSQFQDFSGFLRTMATLIWFSTRQYYFQHYYDNFNNTTSPLIALPDFQQSSVAFNRVAILSFQ